MFSLYSITSATGSTWNTDGNSEESQPGCESHGSCFSSPWMIQLLHKSTFKSLLLEFFSGSRQVAPSLGSLGCGHCLVHPGGLHHLEKSERWDHILR